MSVRGVVGLAMVSMSLVASAGAQTISFTFDDGPDLYPRPLMTPAERNEAVLRQLRDRGVQAMFFVTANNGANRPEGAALLKRLADEGHLIANHTAAHADFNAASADLETFTADILACDAVIRTVPGYRRFFRFPFLREGADIAKRDGIRRFLRGHDYRIGYVSIDTSDYVLDQKLRRALERNPSLDLQPWRELHLASLWDNAQAYERLARYLYGREIKHVLLLHHNLVNALFLGDVIDMFRNRGWKIVSPDEAFTDPAYQVAPMLPLLNGSVLETTAQALGVRTLPILGALRTEQSLGDEADQLVSQSR